MAFEGALLELLRLHADASQRLEREISGARARLEFARVVRERERVALLAKRRSLEGKVDALRLRLAALQQSTGTMPVVGTPVQQITAGRSSSPRTPQRPAYVEPPPLVSPTLLSDSEGNLSFPENENDDTQCSLAESAGRDALVAAASALCSLAAAVASVAGAPKNLPSGRLVRQAASPVIKPEADSPVVTPNVMRAPVSDVASEGWPIFTPYDPYELTNSCFHLSGGSVTVEPAGRSPLPLARPAVNPAVLEEKGAEQEEKRVKRRRSSGAVRQEAKPAGRSSSEGTGAGGSDRGSGKRRQIQFKELTFIHRDGSAIVPLTPAVLRELEQEQERPQQPAAEVDNSAPGDGVRPSTAAAAAGKDDADDTCLSAVEVSSDHTAASKEHTPFKPAAAHKYREVVRRKAERELLKGHACPRCRAFYEAVGHEHLACKCSRHRYREGNTPPDTPPGFWDLAWLRSP